MKTITQNEVFIYGIFNPSGSCAYVGSTCWPEARFRAHISKRGKFYRQSGMRLRVIRQTSLKNASRIERQIGMAYRKRGQAILSRSWPIKSRKATRLSGNPIYIESFQEPFATSHLAAKSFGCDPCTIAKGLKRGWLYKVYGKEVVYFKIGYAPIPYAGNYEI